MVSDDSVDELVSFASALGMPRHWLQNRRGSEHYDLSPRLRAKAISWGARSCSAREIVEHVRLRRERERERQAAAIAELEARSRGAHGPRRG